MRRQVVAAILYREDVPELYSATVASGTAPIPCVTIRSADGWQLAENTPEIELRVDTTPSTLRRENLLAELGGGPDRCCFWHTMTRDLELPARSAMPPA